MKFRIKDQKFKDGNVWYVAQVRIFFIWFGINRGTNIKSIAMKHIENYKSAYIKYHYIDEE